MLLRVPRRLAAKRWCSTLPTPSAMLAGREDPATIVESLGKHVIGQDEAKRSVALALRSRWRRMCLSDDERREIQPMNILMRGPTGSGKTELARRLAALCNAPFVKVEATSYTELGIVGRDTDSMIKDLINSALDIERRQLAEERRDSLRDQAARWLVESFLGHGQSSDTQQQLHRRILSGDMDDVEFAFRMPETDQPEGEGARPEEMMERLMGQLQGLMSRAGGGSPFTPPAATEQVTVAEAMRRVQDAMLSSKVREPAVARRAIQRAEESGIVFIDEIDKICSANEFKGGDASAEGVQRDLLPLIEGCNIRTSAGSVNTDHILFIASGAFHQTKPSDLLPELQGRLPIRVELQRLSEDDLYRILTEPEANLIQQQVALLGTEDVKVEFEDDAIRSMARYAAEINTSVEHIGARRLHTVIERIMEVISFDAPEMEPGTTISVTAKMVEERLSPLLRKGDLSKFIL
mmetsp:Transcript_7804/g.24497  ORF Transcript_7804/g.24497 Transcript_7804/m.24497 type:complete len:466 (+) Transcript_7804:19-1416(+)